MSQPKDADECSRACGCSTSLAEAMETVELWVDLWANDQAEIEEESPCDIEERKVIAAVRVVLNAIKSKGAVPEELNDRCGAGSTTGVYEQVTQPQDGFSLFQQLDLAEKQKQSLLNTLARIAHFATGPCSMTTGSRLTCIANECRAVVDGIGGIGKTTNLFDAAPELLEAVEAMLEEYEEGRNIQPFEIREMCRKARGKATGKPYGESA